MSWKLFRGALLLPLALVIPALPAAAQSGAEVLEAATARFMERMSGIDNYTIVMDVMGYEVTNYFERREIGGEITYDLFYNGFMQVADRAQLEGKEDVDGHDCHVVKVDDFSGIDFDPETPDEEEDFRPETGWFYLDSSEYLIRRMSMKGQFRRDDEWQPMTMEILFKDYREVDGMLHPFVAEMNVAGLTDSMSEEEIEEARKSLEEMKARMAELPESQRAAVERMMKGQMEQLENIVNSGSMRITTEVKELRVNSGPPS
jgi:hypothetical protein